MTSFLDGPAADVSLALRRAPFFLRVVRSPGGEWDALDQLDDAPKPREAIAVYVRLGEPMRYHIRCSPRSASGYYESARYRLHDQQPDDAAARSTDAWRAWCVLQAGRLGLKTAKGSQCASTTDSTSASG